MNCIYVIQDKTNGKYYVGSHQDSSNVEDKSYLGSGEAIKAAVEEKGAENFNGLVLATFENRHHAYEAEKDLLTALDAANDENSYNKSNEVYAPSMKWYKKLFHKRYDSITQLEGWKATILDGVKNTGGSTQPEGNDFHFESQLGNFLEHGFDAYSEEGERQGYDDPSDKNWVKQVKLLKVQLSNNIEREYFIKKNKFSILQEVFKSADDIVGEQMEFIMQMKRAQNEMEYIEEQRILADKEEGWYTMLHEALHDGFQSGSKRKIDELNDKYGLS